MEEIRIFVAIGLPDELKQELAGLEARLQSSSQSGVKWVDPYGIHLTLKFLGNVAVNRISEITKAMDEASRGVSSFQLRLSGLGAFPNLRRVQVAWVGMDGEVDKLGQLQQRIESHLAPLGFAPESRKFTPHLTLARVRNQVPLAERQRFGQLITDTEFEAIHGIEVDAIRVMKSQLTREGAIYTQISSVLLK